MEAKPGSPLSSDDAQQSEDETRAHIEAVRTAMVHFCDELYRRASRHDASKLCSPEREGFARLRTALSDVEYGTAAYRDALIAAKDTVEHHYQLNDHHPEYYPIPNTPEIEQLRADIMRLRQLPLPDSSDPELLPALQRIVGQLEEDLAVMQSQLHGMSLMAIVEMFCDHKASSGRTKNGSLARSIQFNRERFRTSQLLAAIFENTRRELKWE